MQFIHHLFYIYDIFDIFEKLEITVLLRGMLYVSSGCILEIFGREVYCPGDCVLQNVSCTAYFLLLLHQDKQTHGNISYIHKYTSNLRYLI